MGEGIELMWSIGSDEERGGLRREGYGKEEEPKEVPRGEGDRTRRREGDTEKEEGHSKQIAPDQAMTVWVRGEVR